jgi:nucleoside-diphosphate-sugar epimerase
MKVLVTGATGFVGSALCGYLIERGLMTTGVVRHFPTNPVPGVDYQIVSDLNKSKLWKEILVGMDVVVHCAARAHVMTDSEVDPLAVFREVNVEGTRCLAEQAASYGIKRFIYISSIKVNGEGTGEQPLKADDIPAPEDAYGISKWEAEQVLQKIACNSKLEIVIIRPPLVYGPEVRANFLKLMRLVKSGLPLPLGAIRNSRSFVALDNLVDLILTCLQHPAAIDQTFLVSDGDDLSTPELLRRTAKAFGKSPRLIPIPVLLLKATALLLGKKDFYQRLCGSLQIDIGKAKQLLGWTPKVSVDAALLKTTKHFLEITGRH